MPENGLLLPEQEFKTANCRLSYRAWRALERLRSPGHKKGEVGRIVSELLIAEEAREEARRKTIRGALYGAGKHRKRKTPPTAA